MYRQCLLTHNRTSQVAWIPAELAVVGRYVRIETWNWEVKSALAARSEEFVLAARDRHREGLESIR